MSGDPDGRWEPTAREKWETELALRRTEIALRERETAVQEREQISRERELDLQRQEQARSRWINPLVVAILAATLAAIGNLAISVLEGRLERTLERQRAESARIIEMLKAVDADRAAANLEFLVNAGLIADRDIVIRLKDYLRNRAPGSGAVIASPDGGVSESDRTVAVSLLPPDHRVRHSARAVGAFQRIGGTPSCSTFLVGEDTIVVPEYCIGSAAPTEYEAVFSDSGRIDRFPVNEVLETIDLGNERFNFARFVVARVEGRPGATYGDLQLGANPPAVGQPVAAVMFHGAGPKLAALGSGVGPVRYEDSLCRIHAVGDVDLTHQCDTRPGSAGGPVLSPDSVVIGILYAGSLEGEFAARADVIVAKSRTLKQRGGSPTP